LKSSSLRLSSFAVFAATTLSVLVTAPRDARAEDDDEIGEPVPKPRPTPPDRRSFRPTFSGHIGFSRAAGSAETGRRLPNAASWGFSPGFEVRLPIHRHVSLEAWGSFGQYKGGTDLCPTCSLGTSAFGGGVVYHLLDGVPLDPWVSFGVGYRTSKVTFDGRQSFTYAGVEPFRVAVGMDRYVVPQLGLGLYGDISVGEFSSRDPGPFRTDRTGALHTFFSFGVRGVLSPFASF
jgi:hypothetical protein